MTDTPNGIQTEFEWLHSDLSDIKDWMKEQDKRMRALEYRIYIIVGAILVVFSLLSPGIKLPI